MSNRPGAAVLLVFGCLLIFTALNTARTIIDSMIPWMGPEPEMLIPLTPLVIGIGLVWIGVRLWRTPTQ